MPFLTRRPTANATVNGNRNTNTHSNSNSNHSNHLSQSHSQSRRLPLARLSSNTIHPPSSASPLKSAKPNADARPLTTKSPHTRPNPANKPRPPSSVSVPSLPSAPTHDEDSHHRQSGTESGSDSDEDESDDEEDESGAEESAQDRAVRSPKRTAAMTTSPSRPASSSSPLSTKSQGRLGKQRHASSSSSSSALPPPTASSSSPLSHHDRLRALRAKLARQRSEALARYTAKYGVDGDVESAEDRARAVSKGSGEAAEVFASSQQDGGISIARAPLVSSLTVAGAENPNAAQNYRPFVVPRSFGSMSASAQQLIQQRQKDQVNGRRLGMRIRTSLGGYGAFKPLETPTLVPPLPPPQPIQPVAPPAPPSIPDAKPPEGFEPLIIWSPSGEELAANPLLASIEVPPIVCKWLRPHQREGVKFMAECVLGLKNLMGEQTKKKKSTEKKNDDNNNQKDAEGDVKEGENAMDVLSEHNNQWPTSPSPSPSPSPPPPSVSVNNPGAGTILADDMGLGKTLQSVGLIYTLLTQGFEVGSPIARKVIVVTPTSLVSNWKNEIVKWLGTGRVNTVALSEVGRENIESGIDAYTAPNSKVHVLIISYDSFRRQVEKLNKPGLCDLLICDEAHRLKNNKTSTYEALDSLPCRRRVLLSGTPMQNDLSEFFSMINFTNRHILGDRKCFRRYYELPILLGREPDALESEGEMGSQRAAELSAIVNQFVLRRTNVLLKKHLPPKVVQVVCCRPSPIQVQLYQLILRSKSVRKLTSEETEGEGGGRSKGGLQALPLITSLKKLCQHPKLIYDTIQGDNGKSTNRGLTIRNDDGSTERVPPALANMFRSAKPLFEQYESGAFLRAPGAARWSGKLLVLERLLMHIRATSTDRMVIVSNFTSALDVIADLCVAHRWDHLRLDGSTSIKARQRLVDELGDHRGNRIFVFLLSSRAGGCGLNLVGANRLVLFDPDWNPAVDKQAAARVWRDGQKKRCFIYRFLTTGTIEEKIYQRQISKEGLAGVLGGSTADAALTKDELKDLFKLDSRALEHPSDTHSSLECACMEPYEIRNEEEATKAEEAQKREAEEYEKQRIKAKEEEEEAAKAKAKDAAKDSGDETGSNGSTTEEGSERQTSDEQEPGEGGTANGESGEPGSGGHVDHEGEMDVGMEDEGKPNNDENGDGDDPSSDDDGDDGEMDDFIVNDDDDDDEDDWGSKKKKSKSTSKKGGKKDGPRKQRFRRSRVGSLNFAALHQLDKPTIGQRGEPPEEELINWAHHATTKSIPDPAFRAAAKCLPLTPAKLPYVSFVFSCEVGGQAIANSSDAADAAAVSAKCGMEPTTVAASKPLVISLEEAQARHREYMREYNSRLKRRHGLDSDDELPDPNNQPRRHSRRLDHAKPPPTDNDLFVDGGGGRRPSRHNNNHHVWSVADADPNVLAELDEATRKEIERLQALDQGNGRRKRGRPAQTPVKKAVESSDDHHSSRGKPMKRQKQVENVSESDSDVEMADDDDDDDGDDGQHTTGKRPAPTAAEDDDDDGDIDELQPGASKRDSISSPKPKSKPHIHASDTKPKDTKKSISTLSDDMEESEDEDDDDDDDDSQSDDSSSSSDVQVLSPPKKRRLDIDDKKLKSVSHNKSSPKTKPSSMNTSTRQPPSRTAILDDDHDDFLE